ncbi:hypothetical protein A2154_03930 [Candidatus Gottesmanbacteria bacterium RBG_16_43_7]|uniref:Septum formation initiator n=1 Tax=Candidatus Gottesmanbacteria bacterium RBG_16_43_7 TaxID=1798373 RepID=A0A1F5Z9E2_9BACT|nr:MAG: hypothetical protein A2154_03930 [Candidatus Gottesmanbacteria bacterium RBG_16_43_7]
MIIKLRNMKILKNPLFSFFYLTIGLLLIVNLLRSIYEQSTRKNLVTERIEAQEKVRQENIRLKREIEKSQQPFFIETQARDALGLVKPGETMVIMTPSEATAAGETEVKESVPWRAWWKLFF